ncbi:hypothetical protein DFH09DRAFT_355259 [Mycena vulgaris]|nr:hypothetical protein DFH09DRAFT_355259 [Mycena vulgaris]
MATNTNHPSNISKRGSTAFELRSRLDPIEQRMIALESQMAMLRTEQDELLKDLAAIVYPILTLPEDITSEIFLQYVQDASCQSPLCLASVCRLWRAVALATCRLWTHLTFGNTWTWKPPPEEHVVNTSSVVANRLQYWLPRAGHLPVDLRMKLPPSPSQESDAVFRILAQHSSRWRSLDLVSNGPISVAVDVRCSFSSLEKLSLRAHPSADGPTIIPSLLNALHLRELCLDSVELMHWDTTIPGSQLTTLELWFHGVDECLEMLAHTPNLEVLIFRSEMPGSPPDPSTFPPCILRHLHTIDIGAESSPGILDYLVLPILDHLDLYLTNECAERVEPLIKRSGCSPRKLVLYLYEPDITPIYECISALPSLRDLQMTCLSTTTDDFSTLFRLIADTPSVLPSLETMIIADCPTNIDLLPLVQMLAARTTGMDGTTKLTSFRLSFDQEDRHEEVVDLKAQDKDIQLALDRLGELRSHGLEVEIRSAVKWLSPTINSQMIKEIGTHGR